MNGTSFWCSKCKFDHSGGCGPDIAIIPSGNISSINSGTPINIHKMYCLTSNTFEIYRPDIVSYLNASANLLSYIEHKSVLYQTQYKGARVVTPCMFAGKVFDVKKEDDVVDYTKRWCKFLNEFALTGLWAATAERCGIINLRDHQKTIQCEMVITSSPLPWRPGEYAIFSYLQIAPHVWDQLKIPQSFDLNDAFNKLMNWDVFILEGQLGTKDWSGPY